MDKSTARVWRIGYLICLTLFVACTYSVQWATERGSSQLQVTGARALARAETPTRARATVPRASDDEAACYAQLADAGVSFERVPRARASGVDWPIKLSGAIQGVRVYGGKKDAPTNYLDCRLALALADWAPLLSRAGVVGLQHYSMYRRNGTVGQSSKVSGHALGRAIDVAFFDLRDGRRLSVLDDWKNRARGAAPCEVASTTAAEKTMRDLVCEAAERELFRMVLTPHYNAAHGNHLHLEIGPDHGGSWIG